MAQNSRRRKPGFVERTLGGLAGAFDQANTNDQLSTKAGLLQSIDPRIKTAGTLLLIVASALSRQLWVVAAFLCLGTLIALASRVPVATIFKRIWLSGLFFTGMVALPALFLTPGVALAHLPVLGWRITSQGLTSAAFLILRVLSSATFAITLLLATPWIRVLKALRVLRVPTLFVVILGMTYRYIFLMLQTARDMFESRKSRAIGALEPGAQRRLAVSSVGVLLSKSFQLSNDVYAAMQSRGYRGEVYLLDEQALTPRDWGALAAYIAVAGVGIYLGR